MLNEKRDLSYPISCAKQCLAEINNLRALRYVIAEDNAQNPSLISPWELVLGHHRKQLNRCWREALHVGKAEYKVFSLAAGNNVSFFDRSWPSGHRCLFTLAREICQQVDGANSIKAGITTCSLLSRDKVPEWRGLEYQVEREQDQVISVTNVLSSPAGLIKAVQEAQSIKPLLLDGTIPEGSPGQRAAKKGAETKRKNRENNQEKALQEAADWAANAPKQPLTVDWIAWAISTGKVEVMPPPIKQKQWRYRLFGEEKKNQRKPTQQEIASQLSFIGETKYLQQDVSRMIGKVKRWQALNLPESELSNHLEEMGGLQFMDPQKLDLGIRKDHRTLGQRVKLAEIQQHGEAGTLTPTELRRGRGTK